MTRKEEIKEARHEWYLRTQDADFCAGFQKGAEWADEHPINYDGKAMLYVNNKSHENGYKEAVDKACEWLDCYVDNYLFIDAENKAGIRWDNFINDFRKAMKGD